MGYIDHSYLFMIHVIVSAIILTVNEILYQQQYYTLTSVLEEKRLKRVSRRDVKTYISEGRRLAYHGNYVIDLESLITENPSSQDLLVTSVGQDVTPKMLGFEDSLGLSAKKHQMKNKMTLAKIAVAVVDEPQTTKDKILASVGGTFELS